MTRNFFIFGLFLLILLTLIKQNPNHTQGNTLINSGYFAGDTSKNSFQNFNENTFKLNMNMIAVKGGIFTMGDTLGEGAENEMPAHKVKLGDFYIAETEITQKQWRKVMGTSPSSIEMQDFFPVDKVSWNDVQLFIAKLNAKSGKKYRLPTEAEWEFAARGGLLGKGYRYAGSDVIGDVAWYYDNSGHLPNSIKKKKPNELGIYDMTGNVWEWVNDIYGPYQADFQENPKGPESGSSKVCRGGSWDDFARNCRITCRRGFSADRQSADLGFRLAMEP